MADKDFRVKNKLHVNGLNNASGVILATNNALDSHTTLPTQYGGTGTTTSPNAGQILYSSSGSTYSPTTLTSLDVKGATYSADAPSSPFVGQVWIESDSSSDSFDPNIMRRKTITATASQTVFTTDYVFIDGYEQVYFNGLLLLRNTDYTTAGSSSTVTLSSGAAAGDIVEIVTITNLNSINAATTTTNTFTGLQTVQNEIRIQATDSFYSLYPSTGGRYGYIQGTGTSLVIASDSGALQFNANNSERMRIDSSGNIGIGTTTSLSKLTALSTSSIVTNSVSTRNPIASIRGGNDNNRLEFYVDNSAATAIMGLGAWNTAGGNTALTFYTGPNVDERMRIDTAGNLFVGLIDTGSSVYGGKIILQSNAGSQASIFLRQSGIGSGHIGFAPNSSNLKIVNTYSDGLISNNTGINIDTVGNIGIGTSAPANFGGTNLQVTHSTNFSSLLINSGSRTVQILSSDINGVTAIGTRTNHHLGFTTNDTERMRVDTNGYLLVGYTSSNGAYRLQVNSQIFATSSTIATSDGRYKENVNTIESGLDIIDSLRPVSFDWKEHPVHNFPEGKTVGFIAQEVQEALSGYDWVDNIIKTNISEAVVDEEGNVVNPEEEFLGIAEGNLIPLLVAAVKELKSRVEVLESNNV